MTEPRYVTPRRAQGVCEGCGEHREGEALHSLTTLAPLWHPGCAIHETERLAKLLAAAPALYEAISGALEWFDNPEPESHPATERFERHAAAFLCETGLMAPGKDLPAAAYGGAEEEDERRVKWRAWCEARHDDAIDAMRAALRQAEEGSR